MTRFTLLPVVVFAVVGSSVAAGEQERVDGMGRTRGWVVAGDGGELGFVDCHGGRSPLGSARVESTTQRCPRAPARFTVDGVIRRIDTVRRIVYAEDRGGHVRAFHVPDDGAQLENLNPGERIQATGPIDGQATAIIRQ
jgi:hypothetical protein